MQTILLINKFFVDNQCWFTISPCIENVSLGEKVKTQADQNSSSSQICNFFWFFCLVEMMDQIMCKTEILGKNVWFCQTWDNWGLSWLQTNLRRFMVRHQIGIVNLITMFLEKQFNSIILFWNEIIAMSINFDNYKIISHVYDQFDGTSIFELSEGDSLIPYTCVWICFFQLNLQPPVLLHSQ